MGRRGGGGVAASSVPIAAMEKIAQYGELPCTTYRASRRASQTSKIFCQQYATAVINSIPQYNAAR